MPPLYVPSMTNTICCDLSHVVSVIATIMASTLPNALRLAKHGHRQRTNRPLVGLATAAGCSLERGTSLALLGSATIAAATGGDRVSRFSEYAWPESDEYSSS